MNRGGFNIFYTSVLPSVPHYISVLPLSGLPSSYRNLCRMRPANQGLYITVSAAEAFLLCG